MTLIHDLPYPTRQCISQAQGGPSLATHIHPSGGLWYGRDILLQYLRHVLHPHPNLVLLQEVLDALQRQIRDLVLHLFHLRGHQTSSQALHLFRLLTKYRLQLLQLLRDKSPNIRVGGNEDKILLHVGSIHIRHDAKGRKKPN